VGFWVVLFAVPSPHDHSHEIGVLVDVSVAVIEFGIRRKFLFIVNDATGGVAPPEEVTIVRKG
jgi:hypothetical protein